MSFSERVPGPYPRDVAEWREVLVPPESDKGSRMVWFVAANYSKDEWRVFTKNDQPNAQHRSEVPVQRPEQPSFTPKAGELSGVSATARVDDGWLVGFNQGEFGAALHWFSPDGQRNYKISDHQVVDFFWLPDGVHAIEGLDHLGISRGSVIRIARPKDSALWQATSMVELPRAPYAVSVRQDNTVLIALSDALVSVGADRRMETLLPDAPWSGFYPNSSVLAQEERMLYLGMRQFVGQFDLTTRKLRLLLPSSEFLYKLPKKDEERIRKYCGD